MHGDEDIEVMAAEIIEEVYIHHSYAHAENVLHRLRELEAEHGHREAIKVLHREVLG